MFTLWATRYWEDSGRASLGEGSWIQNDGHHSGGCDGHGKLLLFSYDSHVSIVLQYVGEGEKLVKSVFSLARRLAPCVVFLDEIDALFGARTSSKESGGGAFAHRGVITEFMQAMDGLRSSVTDNVVIIGATNRPFDLDDAILRRLPRRLLIDLPGQKEREGKALVNYSPPLIYFLHL